MEITFDREYVYQTIREIMDIDSPSGFAARAIDYVERWAGDLGLEFSRTNKGNGVVSMKGEDTSRTVGLCAHMDTLGLMVRSIKENGRLAFTRVGGPILPTLDSELCRVYTRTGEVYEGTIFSMSPAAHVYPDAGSRERTEETMEVILDEKVTGRADTEALGIQPGDYICFDPKTVITDRGFIKSRFLDDKLSVAILMGVLHHMVKNGIRPACNVKVLFSTYEEVGHGMSSFPEDIPELLCVDMGCVGKDLGCTEYQVSICAKDSSGPYDYEMTSRLIRLAKENGLGYAVDIYPQYSSDASAALRGGRDIRAALIGAGVFASHGYERSHYEGVENCMKLVYLYLTEKQ